MQLGFPRPARLRLALGWLMVFSGSPIIQSQERKQSQLLGIIQGRGSR